MSRRRGRTWRDDATVEVARLIEMGRAQGLEGKTLVRYVRSGGPRRMHGYWPYKVFCEEVDEQLLGGRLRKRRARRKRRKAEAVNQGFLFDNREE